MSKYNTKEAEPEVAGAIIAAEHLLDEARSSAFGPPSVTFTNCGFFTGKPKEFEIDRDKDGNADATGKISYTWLGNVDRIDVNTKSGANEGSKEYSVQFNKFLGTIYSASVDMKGDGTSESTLHPSRGWFSSKMCGLKIDKNNDDKVDAELSFNRAWFTSQIYQAGLDKNYDGKVDNYYDLKRHWFSGNFEKIEEKKE